MSTVVEPPIESHAVHCDRMLEHAEQMTAGRDRLQASEKMWGAAAHAIKAIADARGWPYHTHSDARAIARHIAERMGDREIFALYLAMEGLHQNFYNDRYTLGELRDSLELARRLVALLRDADARMKVDTPMPQDSHYRRRAKKAARQA